MTARVKRRWEVWALYEVPVRMSRHWTRKAAERAALRWQHDPWFGNPWLPHEVREVTR
ncbi:hypothetical protein [Cellulomonas composti]|uniref:Uncharacterized protein n=1 Tax=Cellulomonas composti TaxID=266130 RepID=A0A511JBM5_9CELL|nr:hypothetical protein [Cellulomonas composti]GEL95378.1 hypothetical protein CCO02nite_20360 [Cellulomonas composti]